MSYKEACSECKGTGYHEAVPEYFIENGELVAKYKYRNIKSGEIHKTIPKYYSFKRCS